jgi:hypothetical protein
MSKPNPNITANLLNNVLGKSEQHHEDGPARADKKAHAEIRSDKSTPKPPKLKAAKNAASGQSHMRSSNRGK